PSGTGQGRTGKGRARADGALAAHRLIHLCYAGRVADVETLLAERGHILRRAPHELRRRSRFAVKILLVAQGRPKQALRGVIALSAQNALTPGREPWVDDEARLAYFIAALGSNGP